MTSIEAAAKTKSTGDALEPFERWYAERLSCAATAKAAGRKVIGHYGADVPHELIIAAGAQPVRLAGIPGAGTELADRYLGAGADPQARSVTQGILTGAYGPLDGILFSHDTEQPVRLFNMLRELKRVEPAAARLVPEIYLYDLLHMPHRTSGIYNRVRTRQLIARLESWTGCRITDDALRSAISVCNANRSLLQKLRADARADDVRLSGVEFLKVASTSFTQGKIEHSEALRSLLAQSSKRTAHAGSRLFVTGSDHDNTQFYDIVEAVGACVVGEDHDWGDRGFELLTAIDNVDPLDAIVDRYQFCPPAGSKFPTDKRAAYTASRAVAAGAEAVVCFIRDLDEGPRWDCPKQRQMLSGHGIPYLLIDNQAYTLQNRGQLSDDIAAFLEGAVKSKK
jgi:benzoyl-CoA reductase/2-hydroxyglutaryl-CoA dehydratase subunit BcrC/BadD/HgdB